MMNRSKDLRRLFRESLKNHSSNITVVDYRGNNNHHREGFINFNKDIRIFFYEWSNVENAPRCFYSLDAFESFLKTSGVKIELYQKEIIKNLGNAYITCYDGTRNLCIRGTWKNLNEVMKADAINKLARSIQAPNIIEETCGRWPQNDGTFFG